MRVEGSGSSNPAGANPAHPPKPDRIDIVARDVLQHVSSLALPVEAWWSAALVSAKDALAAAEHAVAPHPGVSPTGWPQPGRLAETWQAVEKQFSSSGPTGFSDLRGASGPPSVWTFSQTVAAALYSAKITGDYSRADRLLDDIEGYHAGNAYAPGWHAPADSQHYYDDNGWVGLDLMQAYTQTHDKKYLDRAKRLFPFFEQGIQKNGGLLWCQGKPYQAAAANGSAMEYALELYQATHDDRYLKFAKGLHRFVTRHLVTPDGLVKDGLNPDGKVGPAIYSYNQGTFIGSDVLLYQATGDSRYLDDARHTARAALSHLGSEGIWKQPPSFNGIFFRNLMALDAVAPDPRYREALDTYAERAWKQARSPSTGLFSGGGIGHYGKRTPDPNLLDTSGMLQILALQSLAGPTTSPGASNPQT